MDVILDIIPHTSTTNYMEILEATINHKIVFIRTRNWQRPMKDACYQICRRIVCVIKQRQSITTLRKWGRDRWREKRGSILWKGFVQEKKTNPIEKIEVWRFLLDNNSKFSATLHKTHARIYIPIGALNCCKNELNCAWVINYRFWMPNWVLSWKWMYCKVYLDDYSCRKHFCLCH